MRMSTTAAVATRRPVAPDAAPITDPGSGVDTDIDTRLVARDGGSPARALSRARRAGGPQLRVVREAGMATAEYAVALIAACAFAAVLLTAVRSGAVLSAIGKLIEKALEVIS